MKFRALIADLDGTLLDSLQDVADSTNAALAKLGLPSHDTSAYRYFVGDGRKMMALRSLPEERRDDATLNALIEYINEEYSAHWMDTTRPFDGIPDMLDALTSRGVRLAVLSNKPHHYTTQMIARLLPQWPFEMVRGESPETPRKPDPLGALAIAAEMQVDPAECLYIGDSGIDMQTAATAGMYGVGVLWGFRPADEMVAHGARALVEHPMDIVRLFDARE
jgi:phosphoglycolate phosphatase